MSQLSSRATSSRRGTRCRVQGTRVSQLSSRASSSCVKLYRLYSCLQLLLQLAGEAWAMLGMILGGEAQCCWAAAATAATHTTSSSSSLIHTASSSSSLMSTPMSRWISTRLVLRPPRPRDRLSPPPPVHLSRFVTLATCLYITLLSQPHSPYANPNANPYANLNADTITRTPTLTPTKPPNANPKAKPWRLNPNP